MASSFAQRPLEIPTLYADGTAVAQIKRLGVRALERIQGLYRAAATSKPDACGEPVVEVDVEKMMHAHREMLRVCLVHPEPTEETLAELEDDNAAFVDLIERIRAHNGGDRKRAVRDFRAGDAEPEGPPPTG